MNDVEEPAKATQEVAKFGAKALEVIHDAGRYVAKVLGSVPEDAVGLMGGDWLRFKRAENILRLSKRTDEILASRKVGETREVPPKFAGPLFTAAADDNHDELRELWARLLASAMDPNRSGSMRQSFVDALKGMDPMDARVFAAVQDVLPRSGETRNFVSHALNVSIDEVQVSFENLERLGLNRAAGHGQFDPTATGRQLWVALKD